MMRTKVWMKGRSRSMKRRQKSGQFRISPSVLPTTSFPRGTSRPYRVNFRISIHFGSVKTVLDFLWRNGHSNSTLKINCGRRAPPSNVNRITRKASYYHQAMRFTGMKKYLSSKFWVAVPAFLTRSKRKPWAEPRSKCLSQR